MTKWEYIYAEVEEISDYKLNGLFIAKIIYNLSRANMTINFTNKELLEFKDKITKLFSTIGYFVFVSMIFI